MKVSNIFTLICLLAFALPSPRLFAHGDLHFRIGEFTDLLSRDTNNAALYLQRGELHRQHQDWKAAEADYARAEQLDPKLAIVEFCRGQLQADSGDLAKARATFDRYIATNSKNAEAFIARARLLAKLGERKPATADFTRGIELSPSPQPEYFIERSQTLVADGLMDEALRGLDEGVKRLGPIVTIQVAAIDLEVTRKHYDSALARLDTILSQASRKESWLAKRGDIETTMGQPAAARKSYEASLTAVEALPLRYKKSHGMLVLKVRLNGLLTGMTNAPAGSVTNAVK